jgi:hypothetical protein
MKRWGLFLDNEKYKQYVISYIPRLITPVVYVHPIEGDTLCSGL